MGTLALRLGPSVSTVAARPSMRAVESLRPL